MSFKFNPIYGTLDLVGSSTSGSGDVTGIPPSDDKAIARYQGTTGKIIQNSKTQIQDGGSIEAQGFITKKSITDNVTINSDEVMITDGFSLELMGELVIEEDGELVIV